MNNKDVPEPRPDDSGILASVFSLTSHDAMLQHREHVRRPRELQIKTLLRPRPDEQTKKKQNGLARTPDPRLVVPDSVALPPPDFPRPLLRCSLAALPPADVENLALGGMKGKKEKQKGSWGFIHHGKPDRDGSLVGLAKSSSTSRNSRVDPRTARPGASPHPYNTIPSRVVGDPLPSTSGKQ